MQTVRPVLDLAGRRDRARHTFARGVLCKPANEAGDSPAGGLAPLIVCEVEGAAGDDLPAVRALVAYPASAVIHGNDHRQWAFYWSVSPNGDLESGPPGGDDDRMPGDRGGADQTCRLRITLDSAGHPVIWETRSPGDAAVEIYVTRSLEAAAGQALDGPLAGNAFAVEPDPGDAGDDREAPPVAVVGVLDDGPVPMGPMVYLDASGRVSAVSCRCMPSQVSEIVATAEYRLEAGDPADNGGGLPGDPSWLERALRLPQGW